MRSLGKFKIEKVKIVHLVWYLVFNQMRGAVMKSLLPIAMGKIR